VSRRAFVKEAAEKFGDQCIVVAIDAKKVSPPGALARWKSSPRGAQPDRPRRHRVCPRGGGARRRRNPAHLDGPGRHPQGFDIALTRAIADAVPVPVIASGGVGTLDHLVAGIRDGHATAVLAASIFHFGEHTVREAKAFMAPPACRCGSILERGSSSQAMRTSPTSRPPFDCRKMLESARVLVSRACGRR